MKVLKILSLILFAIAPALCAQQINENLFLKQANQQSININAETNDQQYFALFSSFPFLSGLQQIALDANSIATINIEGDDNTALIIQAGTANVGLISIDGNTNNTSLDQNGVGLFSLINIEGNFNTIDINQDGTGLQNLIAVSGSRLNVTAEQTNAGIEFMQSGTGGVPLHIQRTGRAIPIIITNN